MSPASLFKLPSGRRNLQALRQCLSRSLQLSWRVEPNGQFYRYAFNCSVLDFQIPNNICVGVCELLFRVAHLLIAKLYCFPPICCRPRTVDVVYRPERWWIAKLCCVKPCVPWIPSVLHYGISLLFVEGITRFWCCDFLLPLQTDTSSAAGSPSLLALSGKPDAFSLCKNQTVNDRLDLVFSPVTGHPHYSLADCSPVNVQVIQG